jgi:uncharacterized protein
MMEKKNFGFKLDKLNEEGEFTGYLSVFGNVDSWGDIVEQGAFRKTLSENSRFPLLNYHDPEQVIGDFEAEEDKVGLRINASLELGVQKAKEKYLLLKRKVLKGLSIGFETIKEEWDKESEVRRLLEVKLWEGSIVTFPANELATVDDVKASPEDILRVIEILRKRKALSREVRGMLIKAQTGINALIGSEPPTGTHTNAYEPHTDGKPLIEHLKSMRDELLKLNQLGG